MSRKCTRVLRGRGHSSTMLFAAGGVEAAAALFARSLTSSCLLSQTSTSNLFKNNFSTAASPAASPARPARVTLATSTWPCPSTTPWSSGEEVIFFFAFFSSFFYLFSRSLTFNLLLLSLSLSFSLSPSLHHHHLHHSTLYKLLKSTCLHCFRFRMRQAEADALARRLALLREGRAVEAASLAAAAPPASRRQKKEGEDGEGGISLGSDDSDDTSGSEVSDDNEEMEDGAGGEKGAKKKKEKEKRSHAAPSTPPPPPPSVPSRSSSSYPPTSLCIEAARELAAELFRRQPASVCANCGCHNPSIKRDGVSKLFVARLPPHREAQNAAAGVPVLPAVPAPGKEGEVEGQEASNHEAVALEQALTAATATASANAVASPSAPSSLALADRRDLTGAAAAGLRLMTPAEAREVARRIWVTNEPLLRELYAKNAPGGVFFAGFAGSGGSGGRFSSSSSHSSSLRWRETYRSFFVSTVAVPPNRLRPPSRLGDVTFEHPHNVALAAVVTGSADVANAAAPKRGLGGGGASGNGDGNGGGNGNGNGHGSAAAAPPDLAAGLRAWLSLQSALNSLIDSSAPDARGANAGAAGVRQALEKKEVRSFVFFFLEEEEEEKENSLKNLSQLFLSKNSKTSPSNRACSAST